MKKYVIGKPRRVLAVVNMILWLPLLFMIIFFGISELKESVSLILFGIFFLLLDLLIAGPMIYSSGMWWSVDDQTFKYSSFRKLGARIKAFYLPHRYYNYFLSLKVDQINKITLGWQNIPYPPFGLISHPIIFTIEMKDGSIIELIVLYTRESKKFVKACHYIKTLGIDVKDPYALLSVIDNPGKIVSRYIDDIERSVHRD